MYRYTFISAFGVNRWITSRVTVRRESRCIVWFCYVKRRRVLPSLNCSVSRLSQWFMDNLVLSIWMSNVIVLAMLKAIKMNGVSCCVIGNDERSSRSEMDGRWGMLRISRGLFVTSEQKDWTDELSQKNNVLFSIQPMRCTLWVAMTTVHRILYTTGC